MKGQKTAQIREVETLHNIIRGGLVTDWSAAIDGGAHVGTWSVALAGRFGRVVAFEPTKETFGYLCENTAGFPNIECRNEALLDVSGRVEVCQPSEKRKTLTARFVKKKSDGTIECVSIDSLRLQSCGLIKLDLEGAEPLAIAGAVETIARCRPVLVVEIGGLSVRWGKTPEQVHNQVTALGYTERIRSGVDVVFIPR